MVGTTASKASSPASYTQQIPQPSTMKRIYSLLFIPFLASSQAFAQDTKRDQLAVFAGYEQFPELHKRNGYDLGVEWKHYLNKRFYTLVNFPAGVTAGTEKVSNDRDGVRDYMLGFGAGYDLLKIKRNTIYLQASVGLGTTDEQIDGIVLSPTGAYDIVKTFTTEATSYAISVAAGYDYQLTNFLAIGVNYTGWQIGFEF